MPVVGCPCPTCTSTDPRDNRLRVTSLLKTRPTEDSAWDYLLLDTSIDLRQQLMRAGAPRVHDVVFTHAHVDHFFGLDELRAVQFLSGLPIDIHASEEVRERLLETYQHLFNPDAQKGGGILSVNIHPLSDRFRAGPLELIRIPVLHGTLPVDGFRWGDLAYVTDCSFIPDTSWPLLEGIDTLVLDALRRRPHPTHFSIDQALEVVARIHPRRTYFIHMTHDLLHAETNASLPDGVELAYDGLEIELNDFDPVHWTI